MFSSDAAPQHALSWYHCGGQNRGLVATIIIIIIIIIITTI
jgi:hypothetical protein